MIRDTVPVTLLREDTFARAGPGVLGQITKGQADLAGGRIDLLDSDFDLLPQFEASLA